MSDLKACPLCHSSPATGDRGVSCCSSSCPLYLTTGCTEEQWNHRPEEDRLVAEVRRLTTTCINCTPESWMADHVESARQEERERAARMVIAERDKPPKEIYLTGLADKIRAGE